jgi:hypothetical protein
VARRVMIFISVGSTLGGIWWMEHVSKALTSLGCNGWIYDTLEHGKRGIHLLQRDPAEIGQSVQTPRTSEKPNLACLQLFFF